MASIYSNGKGIVSDASMASALGEYIERLQTNNFYPTRTDFPRKKRPRATWREVPVRIFSFFRPSHKMIRDKVGWLCDFKVGDSLYVQKMGVTGDDN